MRKRLGWLAAHAAVFLMAARIIHMNRRRHRQAQIWAAARDAR